jgi:hypothetical protein
MCVQVADLHQLIPTEFLDVGGGVLHNISYTMAILEGLPMNTVVASQIGFMLGTAHACVVCARRHRWCTFAWPASYVRSWRVARAPSCL